MLPASRLTAEGLARFEDFLGRIPSSPGLEPPTELLTNASEVIAPSVVLEDSLFASRFELGTYLHETLSPLDRGDLAQDRHFWSWIALLFFPTICPKKNGQFDPGEHARWILNTGNRRKFHRHLFASPYWVIRAHKDHPEHARAALAAPPGRPGELAEQLLSSQEVIANPALLELATRLYIDPATKAPRRGTGSKGPGTPRRLKRYLSQIDLTWDLVVTSPSTLWSKLPREFDRFKDEARYSYQEG